jgi:hypothetical protein
MHADSGSHWHEWIGLFAPAIAELRQEAGQDRRNIVRANIPLIH